MSKKLILIIILIILSAYVYWWWSNFVQNKVASQTSADTKQVFISINQKLKFFYPMDWKCSEVVENVRVDCYPLTRVEEEYDAGLAQKIVYYPDISLQAENGFGNLVIDDSVLQAAKDQPVVYNETGDIYYGIFYQEFNGCLVEVITLPYINTMEKLSAIIK